MQKASTNNAFKAELSNVLAKGPQDRFTSAPENNTDVSQAAGSQESRAFVGERAEGTAVQRHARGAPAPALAEREVVAQPRANCDLTAVVVLLDLLVGIMFLKLWFS